MENMENRIEKIRKIENPRWEPNIQTIRVPERENKRESLMKTKNNPRNIPEEKDLEFKIQRAYPLPQHNENKCTAKHIIVKFWNSRTENDSTLSKPPSTPPPYTSVNRTALNLSIAINVVCVSHSVVSDSLQRYGL